jgi:hypothetical protein
MFAYSLLQARSQLAVLVVACALCACALVSPYDSYYDESLNTLSSDTAKFLAAASSGGPERSFTSKQSVSYYASTYNLLDRLSERAKLTRALVACPDNAALLQFSKEASSASKLPSDYQSFDCREHQLYAVRFYVDQLKFAHQQNGGLTATRARIAGRPLQTAILGAIQTFLVTKPTKG